MALYVAICLLAALTAVSDDSADELETFKIVWGTTVGLAMAHWFAFTVSARLVASGSVRSHDVEATAAQLFGATAVGLLATIPVLLFPTSVELDLVRIVLACFVALVGYAVARSGGATRARSLAYATFVLVAAARVVLVKNFLIGH